MSGQAITGSRIIVALDYPDIRSALAFVERIDPDQCRLKVGKELFTRAGPQFVTGLVARGFDVFLDLKFHDIPNTVASACHAAAELGVWMINVHALGGERMLLAAREGLARAGRRPLLIAVTILTSMDEHDLAGVGLAGTPADNVMRLAALARACELDGVVCSSRETPMLRARLGIDLLLVTPGIRPATGGGAAPHDQKRTVDVAQAFANGADYIVVGRPIRDAADPRAAAAAMQATIAAVFRS